VTPSCTGCGFAVEWVRTCFASQWRLWRDRPEIVCAGRWVRVPLDTPHFPYPHNYGSRDWTSDVRFPWPALGELPGKVRRYTRGVSQVTIPLPLVIGDADCFANGETFPRIGPAPVYYEGFDIRCPGISITPPPEDGPVIDIADCHTQKFLARLTESVYTSSRSAVESILALRYPGSLAVYYPPNTMPQPGFVVSIIGTTTIVAISGTTNLLQWLGQVLSGLVRPFNNGQFTTYSFWQAAANYVFARLSLTATDPDGQIVFVGHSYGGAVANLCGLVCKNARKERRVSVLTFGSPKPGDDRLNLALRSLQHIHLVADGDIVPYTPPSGTTATLLVWLVSSGVLRNCSSFAWLENSELLNEDGTRAEIAEESAPYDILLDYFLTYVLSPPTLVPGWQHWMENYIRLIVCPGEDPSRPQIEPIAVCFDGSAEYGDAYKAGGGVMFDGAADPPGGGGGGGTVGTLCCVDPTPVALYMSIDCTDATMSRSLVNLIYTGGFWIGSVEYPGGTAVFRWHCRSDILVWQMEFPTGFGEFPLSVTGDCDPYSWDGSLFLFDWFGSPFVTVTINVRDTP